MGFSTVMQLGITCVVMFVAAFGSGMLPLLIEVSQFFPSLLLLVHVIAIGHTSIMQHVQRFAGQLGICQSIALKLQCYRYQKGSWLSWERLGLGCWWAQLWL